MNNEELNIDVKKLRPFTRFIYTIGVLPTSYLLSMTYEEQLIWLCNYLKETVIPTVNNNGLAVEELQNKYIELKSYVDSYFNNLDVQEEVNNKLDDMAESGELADIIAQYLGLAGVLAFNTVAEMSNAENIGNGSICKCLGNITYNDGNGGYYKVRTITSGDVIDNFNIVSLDASNTLVAELIPYSNLKDNFDNKTNIDELHQKRLQSNYYTYGCLTKGVGISAVTNSDDEPAIMGFHNPSELATYTNRDTVAMHAHAFPNVPLLHYDIADTVFGSTIVRCPSLTSEQINNLLEYDLTETIIDVYNSSTRYSGLITEFDPDTKTFTVDTGWYQVGNTTPVTPPNNSTLYVGQSTKVWGLNVIGTLSSEREAESVTAAEFMTEVNHDSQDNTIVDGIANGTYPTHYGYKARGNVNIGYLSKDPNSIGYETIMEENNNKFAFFLKDGQDDTKQYIRSDGALGGLRCPINIVSGSSINSVLTWFNVITSSSSSISLPSPVGKAGYIMFIGNYTTDDKSLTYTNSSQIPVTLTLNAGTFYILMSDGNAWLNFKFTGVQ